MEILTLSLPKNALLKSMVSFFILLSSIVFSGCSDSGNQLRTEISVIHPDLVKNEFTHSLTSNLTFTVGESVELMLYFPYQTVSDIHWQQVSGPSVKLLSATSKVIAFTATEVGEYRFQANVTLNGIAKELTSDITVIEPNTAPAITARLGHEVVEGNKVSLRAFFNEHVQLSQTVIDEAQLTWQQVSNSSYKVNVESSESGLAIYFDAPNVDRDQIISFEVSASYNGETYSDLVAVLIESSDAFIAFNNDSTIFSDRLATVFPYGTTSPYADVLVPCVYSNALTIENSCTFQELPLIAHQNFPINTAVPSIDDIMKKVVVSHAWMGDRFKAFLENNDPYNDFKVLFKATTAIVISYDVRPSFYHPYTGAIYLDPSDLWITPDERDTINEAPDYRSAFGNELNFLIPWRYVKNNESVYNNPSLFYRTPRNIDDALYQFSALLYHELAHANDFYPSTVWTNINTSDSIVATSYTRWRFKFLGSDELYNVSALHGDELFSLAQVSFHGATSTEAEKTYTPDYVSNLFSTETASRFYNYSTEQEDYATTFDEFMMLARYGVNTDVAVTNLPKGSDVSARDYIVTWGQRGRIGEEAIKPRLAFIVERVLPSYAEAQNVITELPKPIDMAHGENWIENLDISPLTTPIMQRAPSKNENSQVRFGEETTFTQRRYKNIAELMKGKIAK